MAFTESQKLKICRIMGVNIVDLQYLLTYNASQITSTVESDVIAELTRWDTAGADFVKLEPTESNKGVKLDSSSEKADIRKNIAVMLLMQDYLNAASGVQGRLVRG